MPQKSKSRASWLQSNAVRVTRVHFLFVASYIISLVIFDSWNLITHDAVALRWTAAGTLLILNSILWYVARLKFQTDKIYVLIVLGLAMADVVFASYNVFWQRGLASKGVALFAVPIIVAATLRSRSALLAMTSLSVAAYSIAIVRYFNLHYGESYRIELYGELAFYSMIFFVLAWLLLIIIRPEERF